MPQRNTMEAVPALVTADAATTKARTTEPVPQRWIALEPSPRPAKQRRRHTGQVTGTEATTLAAAAAAEAVTKKRKRREDPSRSNKKQKQRLSIHINPWTINNSHLRILSERASNTPRPQDVHTATSAPALRLSSPPP